MIGHVRRTCRLVRLGRVLGRVEVGERFESNGVSVMLLGVKPLHTADSSGLGAGFEAAFWVGAVGPPPTLPSRASVA